MHCPALKRCGCKGEAPTEIVTAASKQIDVCKYSKTKAKEMECLREVSLPTADNNSLTNK